MNTLRVQVAALCIPCCVAVSWAQAPSLSKWGPGDRLGALNTLTPALVLRAAQLVKTGKVYSLAIETEPVLKESRQYRALIQPVAPSAANGITGFDDTVILSPALGTTMDGLAHAGRAGRHYNGVRAEEVYGPAGVKVFGIETLPPIVTRGVLLDAARHRRVAVLPEDAAIDRAEIEAIAKAEGIAIRRGDVVLLHTGWLGRAPGNGAESRPREPGLGKDGARFLAGLGVVAVGADNAGVEIDPAESPGEYAPVHQILLVDNGIYLFENVNTRELAADRAYEFLFVAAAPRLAGTAQSNLHPIAIR